MQKHWFDGGGCITPYTDRNSQLNPALVYNNIPLGCRVAEAIGILIIANAVCGMYSLWDFTYFGAPNYRDPGDAAKDEEGKVSDVAAMKGPAPPIDGEMGYAAVGPKGH
jgi:hypothetical protein